MLQAPGEFFSQTQKKSILKMQKLCNGTKDIWDLLKLDRVWNWCYLNKGKMFSSSSSKRFAYLSRCYTNAKLTKHCWNIQNIESGLCCPIFCNWNQTTWLLNFLFYCFRLLVFFVFFVFLSFCPDITLIKYEMSQVSKVTLCVEILKWQWPTDQGQV